MARSLDPREGVLHSGRTISRPTIAAALTSLFVLGACATTVEDQPAEGADVPIEAGTIVDADAPDVTIPIAGSAAELLPDLAAEMSTLGSHIAEGADDEVVFGRIEQIWVVIRAEVEATRPELVGGIETTIDMSRTAVERRRPADADKAFRLLTDLVDNYTGDG